MFIIHVAGANPQSPAISDSHAVWALLYPKVINMASVTTGISVLLNLYLNRGYYMAAGRYEISLRVLKNISRVRAANE